MVTGMLERSVAQSAPRSLQVGGVARTYLVHVPPRAPASGGYPIVLLLHGAGGSGRRIAAHTGMDRIADREGFIAVYPDGLERRWNDGRRGLSAADDVAFIRSLLDTLRRQYRVDSTRIFASGISNGAMLAHRLACDLPGVFAAIAPVAGAMPAAIAERCRQPKVSMIAIQGTADRLVPYAGGSVGERGPVLSARATAEHWARASGCGATPAAESLPDRIRDGTRIQRFTWTGCDRGIALYAVIGGGHTWPGGPGGTSRLIGSTTREIDGAEVIWGFFRRHPKR